MQFLLFLILLKGYVTFDLPRDGCFSDLKINDDYYNLSSTYHVGNVYPSDAHYDDYGNLFYVESGRNEDGFFFDVRVMKQESDSGDKIKGLPKGLSYSVAVDKKNTEVYFGTGQGIYRYSYESHTASPISDLDVKLNMIFVDKDGKKYITESNNGVDELYQLDGDKKIRFSSLDAFNGMTIDDKNNFYYIKDQKLCILKTNVTEPTCVGNISYNGIAQVSFHEEKVYVASQNLTYVHVNEAESLKMVQNIPGVVTAIAFDKNGDFTLGIQGKLLKYKKNDCYIKENVTDNNVVDW